MGQARRLVDHPFVEEVHPRVLAMTLPDSRTVEDSHAMWAAVEAFYATNTQPFGWVVDLSQTQKSDAVSRKLFADHVRSHEDVLRKYCAASAFIAPSRFASGVVQAVMWLYPNKPAPYVITTDREEGIAFAVEKLQAEAQAAP